MVISSMRNSISFNIRTQVTVLISYNDNLEKKKNN